MNMTDKLKEVLDIFENQTLRDTGVGRICGGFARADLTGHDEDYYDIELKWGVQSDCTNDMNVEQYKLPAPCLDNRNAIEIVKDLMDA